MVIAIGRADAPIIWWRGSQAQSGWRHRLLSMLRLVTGARCVQNLASERLETRRLLTCMAVRRDARVQEDAVQLVRLGMAPSAVHEALHRAVA